MLGSLGINALVWSVLGPTVFHAGLWLPALLMSGVLVVWVILRLVFSAIVGARRGRATRLLETVAAEVSSDATPTKMRLEPPPASRIATGLAADAEVDAANEDTEESTPARANRHRE